MTVADEISEHGIAKGNLENSSTIVRSNRFLVTVGKGPLKSRLSLLKGAVAFILTKARYYFTTAWTWIYYFPNFFFKEKFKFLDLIQRYIRVTPGWHSSACSAFKFISGLIAAFILDKESAVSFFFPGRYIMSNLKQASSNHQRMIFLIFDFTFMLLIKHKCHWSLVCEYFKMPSY